MPALEMFHGSPPSAPTDAPNSNCMKGIGETFAAQTERMLLTHGDPR